MYGMSFSFFLARPTGWFPCTFWHGKALIACKEVLPYLSCSHWDMDGWIASVCVSMLWPQYVFLPPISLQKVLLWSRFPVCDITSQYLSSSPCLTNTTQLNLAGMNGAILYCCVITVFFKLPKRMFDLFEIHHPAQVIWLLSCVTVLHIHTHAPI